MFNVSKEIFDNLIFMFFSILRLHWTFGH